MKWLTNQAARVIRLILWYLLRGDATLQLRYRLQVDVPNNKTKEAWKPFMNPTVLPFGFLLEAGFAAKDADGAAAPVENIVFTLSDPTLAEIVPIKDNAASVLIRPLKAGTVQLQLSIDARIGPGVKTLTALGEIKIPAEAVTLGIVFAGLREDVPVTV